MASTSHVRVVRPSSSSTCSFVKALKTLLTVRIHRSHTHNETIINIMRPMRWVKGPLIVALEKVVVNLRLVPAMSSEFGTFQCVLHGGLNK